MTDLRDQNSDMIVVLPLGAHEQHGPHLPFETDTIIAEGIVAAAREVDLKVPLVVRLEGTNVQQGKDILAQSGLAIVPANDLGDAAKKIVAEVARVPA